jgi:hypothetical protein
VTKGKRDMLHTDLQKQLAGDIKPVVHKSRAPTKDKTNITYFMTLPMHRKLKRTALDHNTSMQQLLDEAMGLLFAKYGLGNFEPVPTKK